MPDLIKQLAYLSLKCRDQRLEVLKDNEKHVAKSLKEIQQLEAEDGGFEDVEDGSDDSDEDGDDSDAEEKQFREDLKQIQKLKKR